MSAAWASTSAATRVSPCSLTLAFAVCRAAIPEAGVLGDAARSRLLPRRTALPPPAPGWNGRREQRRGGRQRIDFVGIDCPGT